MERRKQGYMLFDTEYRQFIDADGNITHEMAEALIHRTLQDAETAVKNADLPERLEIWPVVVTITTLRKG